MEPPISLFGRYTRLLDVATALKNALPLEQQDNFRGIIGRIEALRVPEVGVVSGPRTGKSTLLNALLDAVILPTGGTDNPVTSSTIYCSRGDRIRVTLDFITYDAWLEMRFALFKLAFQQSPLLPADGEADALKLSKDMAKIAANALLILKCLYSEELVDATDLSNQANWAAFWDANDSRFTGYLGTKPKTEFKSMNDAYEFICHWTLPSEDDYHGAFYDPKSDKSEPDSDKSEPDSDKSEPDPATSMHLPQKLWPWALINFIAIEAPVFNIPDGVYLVDIPGYGDFNPRRSQIVHNFLLSSSELWFAVNRQLPIGGVLPPLQLYLSRDPPPPSKLQLIYTNQNDQSARDIAHASKTLLKEPSVADILASRPYSCLPVNFGVERMMLPRPMGAQTANTLNTLRQLLQGHANTFEEKLNSAVSELLAWLEKRHPTDQYSEARSQLEELRDAFQDNHSYRMQWDQVLHRWARISQNWHHSHYSYFAGTGFLRQPNSLKLDTFFPNYIRGRLLQLSQRLARIAVGELLGPEILRDIAQITGVDPEADLLTRLDRWANAAFCQRTFRYDRYTITRAHVWNLVQELSPATRLLTVQYLNELITQRLPPPGQQVHLTSDQVAHLRSLLSLTSPPAHSPSGCSLPAWPELGWPEPSIPSSPPSPSPSPSVAVPSLHDAAKLDGTTLSVEGSHYRMQVGNPVTAAGDCFYGALTLVSGVENVRDNVAARIPEVDDPVRQNILRRGVWATEMEIGLIASLLDLRIHIWVIGPSGSLVLRTAHGLVPTNDHQNVHLLHINENHFMALFLQPAGSPATSAIASAVSTPSTFGAQPLPSPAPTGAAISPAAELTPPLNNQPLDTAVPAIGTPPRRAPELAAPELFVAPPPAMTAQIEFLTGHALVQQALVLREELMCLTSTAAHARIVQFYAQLEEHARTKIGLSQEVLDHGIALTSGNVADWTQIKLVTVYEAAKTSGIVNGRLGIGRTGTLDHERSARLSGLCTVHKDHATIFELIKGPCSTLGYVYTRGAVLEMAAITVAQLAVLPHLELIRCCSDFAFGALCMASQKILGQVLPWALNEQVKIWGTYHPTSRQPIDFDPHYIALREVIDCPCQSESCQHWAEFINVPVVPHWRGPHFRPDLKRIGTVRSIESWQVGSTEPARLATRVQPLTARGPARSSTPSSSAPAEPASDVADLTNLLSTTAISAQDAVMLSTSVPDASGETKQFVPPPVLRCARRIWRPILTFRLQGGNFTAYDIGSALISHARSVSIFINRTHFTVQIDQDGRAWVEIHGSKGFTFLVCFGVATSSTTFAHELPYLHRLARQQHFDLLLQELSNNPGFNPFHINILGYSLLDYLEGHLEIMEEVLRLTEGQGPN